MNDVNTYLYRTFYFDKIALTSPNLKIVHLNRLNSQLALGCNLYNNHLNH